MNIKDIVEKYNDSTLESIKNHSLIFDRIFSDEKGWSCNLEDKFELYLKEEKAILSFKNVMNVLKSSDLSFSEEDRNDLGNFTRVIDKTINLTNFLNNYTRENLEKQNLTIEDLFNSAKNAQTFEQFKKGKVLKGTLSSHLPNLFSVIKHIQYPVLYPINYRFWNNSFHKILGKPDNYDELTSFYNQFPKDDRHLNFAAFFGTLSMIIIEDVESNFGKLSVDSKEYKSLSKFISLKKYLNLILNLDTRNFYKYAPGKQAVRGQLTWRILKCLWITNSLMLMLAKSIHFKN